MFLKRVYKTKRGRRISWFTLVTAAAIAALLATGLVSLAAVRWNADGRVICDATQNQRNVQITSDGADGAIITWEDHRLPHLLGDIYAQRVDSSGNTLWTPGGVAISATHGIQDDPQITSDGAGGAIITWEDHRLPGLLEDIYAQRVDSFGNTLWSPGGVAICSTHGTQDDPRIISDGAGGAIVTWEDHRLPGLLGDIYAQRVDSLGNTLWHPGGVAICYIHGDQDDPEITSDGAGGAIITWEDHRLPGMLSNIYVQRVDLSGATLWTGNGVAVCSVPGTQDDQQIASDGAGGAVITWEDHRLPHVLGDIYAQRVDSSGNTVWHPGGKAICYIHGEQDDPQITSDGSGVVITWKDSRDLVTTCEDIYAQRVDLGGAVLWKGDGVAISTASGEQEEPRITSDGTGSVIITWEDNRDWKDTCSDIYAQRVDLSGVVLWAVDGVAISTASKEQDDPEIASDGAGGAVITWEDERNKKDTCSDIYAQRIADIPGPKEEEEPYEEQRELEVRGSTLWYLPEGSTGSDHRGGFQTWILLQNPGEETAEAQITYMTPEGSIAGPPATLEPGTRQTFNVAETVPGNWSVSTMVTSDYPIVAERAMYWDSAGGTYRRSAHDSVGVARLATEWYLAEGSTGADHRGSFQSWVLIQNPGDSTAEVEITYMTPDGPIPGPQPTLAPRTRQTFDVADTVPDNWSVSTTVTSDNPVVCERAMYWDSADGVYRQAAHDSIGTDQPDDTWYLAEGSTGSDFRGGFQTWVLLQNPGSETANSQITYMTAEGSIAGPTATLAPGTRQTFDVSEVVPGNWSVSTMVTSDNPIIAERAMYWDSGGGTYRQSAHDSIGVSGSGKCWFPSLAEGSTGYEYRGGFETWVLVQNPGNAPANIQITYMTELGALSGPTATLAPGTRRTFNVANTVGSVWGVSTMVVSDQPIIAERAMYWSTAQGIYRQAAHNSIGFNPTMVGE